MAQVQCCGGVEEVVVERGLAAQGGHIRRRRRGRFKAEGGLEVQFCVGGGGGGFMLVSYLNVYEEGNEWWGVGYQKLMINSPYKSPSYTVYTPPPYPSHTAPLSPSPTASPFPFPTPRDSPLLRLHHHHPRRRYLLT